jgi:hypothetical protein
MSTRLALSVCGLVLLAGSFAGAQEALLNELYGGGVHAYYAGRTDEAHRLLSSAITQGSQDPRAYYFRGLAASRMGKAAEAAADFKEGAKLEVAFEERIPQRIGLALERIQGSQRMQIEMARREAKLAARAEAKRVEQAKYEEQVRAEREVLRQPVVDTRPLAPAVVPAEAVVPMGADPFAAGAETVKVEAKPMPGAPAAGAADPFGAPAAPGAMPPAADPFGAAPAPAPAPMPPAADPFGAPAPAPAIRSAHPRPPRHPRRPIPLAVRHLLRHLRRPQPPRRLRCLPRLIRSAHPRRRLPRLRHRLPIPLAHRLRLRPPLRLRHPPQLRCLLPRRPPLIRSALRRLHPLRLRLRLRLRLILLVLPLRHQPRRPLLPLGPLLQPRPRAEAIRSARSFGRSARR